MNTIDSESKNYWINRLTSKGWTVTDTDTFDDKCRWDLVADNGDYKVLVELKDRDIASTTFGDNMIELDKANVINYTVANNDDIKSGVTISMFTDGVFFMNCTNDQYIVEQHWANKTTHFDNNEMVLKDFACYKNPRWRGRYNYNEYTNE